MTKLLIVTYKKKSHSQEVETVGQAFLFLGGFEEDYL
jgi:hypothetical protein